MTNSELHRDVKYGTSKATNILTKVSETFLNPTCSPLSRRSDEPKEPKIYWKTTKEIVQFFSIIVFSIE